MVYLKRFARLRHVGQKLAPGSWPSLKAPDGTLWAPLCGSMDMHLDALVIEQDGKAWWHRSWRGTVQCAACAERVKRLQERDALDLTHFNKKNEQ